MAINLEALGAFLRVDNAGSKDIVHVRGDARLGTDGSQGFHEWSKRSDYDVIRNNRTRAEFLKSLGGALGLADRVTERDGVISFSADFMAALRRELGDRVFRNVVSEKDYELRDGLVTSGKPLTERRITAVVNAVIDKARAENVPVRIPGNRRAVGGLVAEAFTPEKIEALNRGAGLADRIQGQLVHELGLDQKVGGRELFEYAQAFAELCDPENATPEQKERLLGRIQEDIRQFVQNLKDKHVLAPTVEVPDLSLDRMIARVNLAAREHFGVPAELPRVVVDMRSGNPPFQTEDLVVPVFIGAVNRAADLGNPFAEGLRILARESAQKRNVAEPTYIDYMHAFLNSDLDPSYAQEVLVNLGAYSSRNPPSAEALGDFRDVLRDALDAALRRGAGKTDRAILFRFAESVKETISFSNNLTSQIPRLREDRVLGRMKDALLQSLCAHKVMNAGSDTVLQTLMEHGGGLGVSTHAFLFKSGGRNYTSTVTPRQQILHDYGIMTDNDRAPLFGLSRTSLTLDEGENSRELVALNRFGSVMSGSRNHAQAHYEDLAVQTFLANPKLVAEARDGGTIDVPIYHIDMAAESSKMRLRAPDGTPLDAFTKTLSFRPDPNGAEITVTLRAKVHVAKFTTDCFADYGNYRNDPQRREHIVGKTLLDKHQVGAITDMIDALLAKASAKVARNEALPKGAEQLIVQLAVHRETLAKRGDFKWFEGCGREMHRLGARIALLAYQLGDVPAINCNMGRDRTGAMDNEVKMLALKLDRGEEISPIIEATDNKQLIPMGDPDRGLRTKLLVKTGNAYLARKVNVTSFGLNTNQSKGLMGFEGLFGDVDEQNP